MSYRILYHHRTQALDGQRVHINAIQEALQALGHEVMEVSPLPATEQAGATSIRTPRRRLFERMAAVAPKGLYETAELAYNLAAYRALSSAIVRFKPHFVYERYALNTVAGVWTSRRFGVPILLEVNSPLADEKRALGKLLFHKLSGRLERYTLVNATRVLAVTQVLADGLMRSTGLPQTRIKVVQNGADLDVNAPNDSRRSAARRELGYTDEDVVIGAIGFFREWHGIDMLLTAVAEARALFASARILLVGDGPAIPDLKQLSSRLGLEGVVTFCGAVAHDRVAHHLSAMDVVAIPRAVAYASPLKLFEYMAGAKAIVAPRQANLLEVVTDGVDAICFSESDRAGLQTALGRVVQDASLRNNLGREARATIERRCFTWNGNAERIIQTFEEVGAPAPST